MNHDLGRIAESAGMVNLLNHGSGSCVYSDGFMGVTQEHLERFAEALCAAERERCAKACEDEALLWEGDGNGPDAATRLCAYLIRNLT